MTRAGFSRPFPFPDDIMNVWRLIHTGYQCGAMNMAIDETLLESVAAGTSPPVLRLYRWRPATVTLGYAQSLERDINLQACREAGLDVVRRATGGRAVLHADEVTYAVIAPVRGGHFQGSVLDSYRVIADILRATLQALQIDAEIVPGSRGEGQGASAKAVCFTAPSQYELVVDGCKVAGSAQKRVGACFLQHGSLPLDMDLDLLARVLPGPAGLPAAQRFRKVGWLNRWCASPLHIDRVEAELVAAFQRQLAVDWLEQPLSAAETQRAERLCEQKYADRDWTGRGDSPQA